MNLPNPKDAIHKAWMYRVLSSLMDQPLLQQMLRFKGGTCAAMLGFLDRFSVDLDFDFIGNQTNMKHVRQVMEKVFDACDVIIADQSSKVPQYFLKYPVQDRIRNTLKIDITFPPPTANIYSPFRLVEIDRIVYCQTIETMFANKLAAIMDRWNQHHSVAGRDIYDVHHFFLMGYRYQSEIIVERCNQLPAVYFNGLISFLQTYVTETVINQDLNVLLSGEKLRKIRKLLVPETIRFLQAEI